MVASTKYVLAVTLLVLSASLDHALQFGADPVSSLGAPKGGSASSPKMLMAQVAGKMQRSVAANQQAPAADAKTAGDAAAAPAADAKAAAAPAKGEAAAAGGADAATGGDAAAAPMRGDYAKIAPFGKEDTSKELQDHAARTQDTLVDAVENAEVAEIKRAVFRALTRLRAASIKEFDTIARLETQAIDEYNDAHHYRGENPLAYLHDDEPAVGEDKYTSFH